MQYDDESVCVGCFKEMLIQIPQNESLILPVDQLLLLHTLGSIVEVKEGQSQQGILVALCD